MGNRASGKSSAANTITASQEVFGGESTTQCCKSEGTVEGRHITLIDTPGWGEWGLVEYKVVKDEVFRKCERVSGPIVYLLVIRPDIAFTNDDRQAVRENLQLFDDKVWNQTTVLFTHGDWLGEMSLELYIESEGRALEWIVEKCGNRYHILNNKNTSNLTQVRELIEKIEEMLPLSYSAIGNRNEEPSEKASGVEAEAGQRVENQEDMDNWPYFEDRMWERATSKSMMNPPSSKYQSAVS